MTHVREVGLCLAICSQSCAPRPWIGNVWAISVCIATLCNERRTCVGITDEKVSFSSFSAEYLSHKNQPIMANCAVLYAGNDMQYAPVILEKAEERLRFSPLASPRDVADALDEAYRDQLTELIEKRILRRYKFTGEKFSQFGKKLCTEAVYNRLCDRIAKVELSARFLVCGFDQEKKRPYLHCRRRRIHRKLR